MRGSNNNYTFAECLDGTLSLLSLGLLEFVASDVIFRAKNCDQPLFFFLWMDHIDHIVTLRPM